MESGYVSPPGSRLLPHINIHVDYLRSLSLSLFAAAVTTAILHTPEATGNALSFSYICLLKGNQGRIVTGDRCFVN